MLVYRSVQLQFAPHQEIFRLSTILAEAERVPFCEGLDQRMAKAFENLSTLRQTIASVGIVKSVLVIRPWRIKLSCAGITL